MISKLKIMFLNYFRIDKFIFSKVDLIYKIVYCCAMYGVHIYFLLLLSLVMKTVKQGIRVFFL